MGLQVQPRDVFGALNGIGAIRNPSGTALAFLGLSDDEQRAGIPGWAWGVAILATGVYLGVLVAPKLKGLR